MTTISLPAIPASPDAPSARQHLGDSNGLQSATIGTRIWAAQVTNRATVYVDPHRLRIVWVGVLEQDACFHFEVHALHAPRTGNRFERCLVVRLANTRQWKRVIARKPEDIARV